MKKSQKFRPDYPVVREGRYGKVFRPVRFLVLQNGSIITLAEEYDGSTWRVFGNRAGGPIIQSSNPPYKMRSVAELDFEWLANELTEPEKKHLLSVARDPTVTSEQRTKIALEIARVVVADDEKCEGIAAHSEQFVASHTPEEVEQYVAEKCEVFDDLLKKAIAAAAGGGEGEE